MHSRERAPFGARLMALALRIPGTTTPVIVVMVESVESFAFGCMSFALRRKRSWSSICLRTKLGPRNPCVRNADTGTCSIGRPFLPLPNSPKRRAFVCSGLNSCRVDEAAPATEKAFHLSPRAANGTTIDERSEVRGSILIVVAAETAISRPFRG